MMNFITILIENGNLNLNIKLLNLYQNLIILKF